MPFVYIDIASLFSNSFALIVAAPLDVTERMIS
jgi:hypothetical protein